MIVIDASALIHVLLRTPSYEELAVVVFERGHSLHAPHLIDAEVAQIVRRYARAGDIDDARGLRALHDLASFRMVRYAHTAMLARVWALRGNITAYDALYVALAEALNAPLLTRDLRLQTAVRSHSKVELV